MTFEVKDASGQYGPDGTVIKTIVTIYQQQPYYATAAFPLDGDHTHKEANELLEMIKQEFFKEHYTAYAFKELDKSVSNQNEKVDKLTKLAEATVLAVATNKDNPVDPTIYKRYLELIDPAVTDKLYHAYDVFSLEDASHEEKFGEGKRVLVQVNKDFTYDGQSVSEFKTGGSLELAGVGAAFPWTMPKE